MREALVCVGSVLCLVGCSTAETERASGDDVGTSGVAPSAKVASGAAESTMQPAAAQPAQAQAQAMSAPVASQAPVQPSAQAGAAATSGDSAAPAQSPSTAQAPVTPPATDDTATPPGIAPPEGFEANAMGQCDLHTKWPGDELCILPPPPDKGFQMHIGPADYDNPDPMYLLEAGKEDVRRFTAQSVNDKDIQFYVRQYRMRPGAHHTIVRDTSTGRRLSGSDVNQDHPIGGIVAPENAGVGIPLAAHSPLSIDHHAINVTDQTLLQEVWVNFWYVDPDKVTETTTLLYDPGNVTTAVAPHEDVVLGPYECDIQSPGRLINMFGHVHANNVRFSAWRTRDGQRDLIYESYHWEDPLWLEFTSLATNPKPDPDKQLDGGWTGILDLQPGDKLSWECHEVNEQNTTLRFTNETYNGWMCIIIGELVGTECTGLLGGFSPGFEFN